MALDPPMFRGRLANLLLLDRYSSGSNIPHQTADLANVYQDITYIGQLTYAVGLGFVFEMIWGIRIRGDDSPLSPGRAASQ